MFSRCCAIVLTLLVTVTTARVVARIAMSSADAVDTAASTGTPAPGATWIAAGPGRVEPISGEMRITATSAGRIEEIFVRVRDVVSKGTLLAISDDREQRARVKSAEAEVEFREAERESALASSVPNTRRLADDAVAKAERDLWRAQDNFDRLSQTRNSSAAMQAAKSELGTSTASLNSAREKLDALLASGDAARPTRIESALAVARAELGIAMLALEKTRIRAPSDGTVLNVAKVPGEMASGAPDDALLVMGNIERLRCKVELDENEIGNIAIGQRVVVHSDAFPNLDFGGTVALIGASARPRVLAGPNSQPTAKDNALEIMVELNQSTPLIPGMRVDAFFQVTNVADGKGGQNGSN